MPMWEAAFLVLVAAGAAPFQGQESSSWLVQTVDREGDTGWWNSIALDSQGNPHIAYHSLSEGFLRYARWTGASWNISVVDRSNSAGQVASLALDSQDRPHIAYRAWPQFVDTLRYARWNGTAWLIVPVDTGLKSTVLWTSMAFDRQGRAHIGYARLNIVPGGTFSEVARAEVKYALVDGESVLRKETVQSRLYVPGSVLWVSVAADSSGIPHLAFPVYTFLEGFLGRFRFQIDLRYARFEGGTWWRSTVRSFDWETPSAGMSIITGTNDVPIIVHRYRNLLVEAQLEAFQKQSPESLSTWRTTIVDTVFSLFTDPATAYDSQGNLHLGYGDFSHTNVVLVRHAVKAGHGWRTETVAGILATPAVSRITLLHDSLVISKQDRVHISYFDPVNQDLKYATRA